MKKVKVGIIGSGFIADHHCYGYLTLPNIEIIGICARHKEDPMKLIKKYGLESEWYKNYQDLLKQNCDIVSICLPNYLHKEVTIETLNSGAHACVEKPLAINSEEGIEMLEAEKSSNRHIFYCENNMFAPSFVKAKKIISEGALGTICMARGREQHSGPHSAWFYKKEKAGGGALLDLGIHDIACLLWFLEDEVKEVFCRTRTLKALRPEFGECTVEDNAMGIIIFENGAQVSIEDSWTAPGGYDIRYEIFGDIGHIKVSPTFSNLITVFSQKGYGYAVEKAETTKGWTFPIPEESHTFGYPQELNHFVDCVINNKKTSVNGEYGVKILRITDAMYKSSKSGKLESVN
ncbi:MAG: putative dehydrogenase [Promethearchaeota archaeon]|nr:MAG: putative dehydrogenase [Candidatus Lokiarchaeota archaeon]